MKPGFWSRIDLFARHSTPFVLTLMLVLVNGVPLHVAGLERVGPVLPLMAVYHWAIYRPDLLPFFAVFLIGLLHDMLSGGVVGVNALVYPLVYWAVQSQQKFFIGKSFAVVWLGFSLVGAGATLVTWLLVSIYYLTPVDPVAPFFQYLVTLGAFPALSWLFLRFQPAFAGA